MNYALAKELKDARFEPQMTTGARRGYYIGPESDQIYVPTLEELIEACGRTRANYRGWPCGFVLIWFEASTKENSRWQAGYEDINLVNLALSPAGDGDTVEEAVAKLWLAINKKV
jgi:hypothetical protein